MNAVLKSIVVTLIGMSLVAFGESFLADNVSPRDLTNLSAQNDAHLSVANDGHSLTVADIADLVASAFHIPVSSEEPWRLDHTPPPFEIGGDVHISKGMNLLQALDKIVQETGDVLTYDIVHQVVVLYPKYAEHRILSCADQKIHFQVSGRTPWEAMKQVAMSLNCEQRGTGKVAISPAPLGRLQPVPVEFTQDSCVKIQDQNLSLRHWLCEILGQSRIPSFYRMGVYYRPTLSAKDQPRTIIVIHFFEAGLKPHGEESSMSTDEKAWWVRECEELLCEGVVEKEND